MKLCNILTNYKQFISNTFNEYFTSIFTVETGIVPSYESSRIVIPDISITEEGVFAALLKGMLNRNLDSPKNAAKACNGMLQTPKHHSYSDISNG